MNRGGPTTGCSGRFYAPLQNRAVRRTTRQVRVPFADGKRRHTRAFARYALELTRHMTIKDLANHLGVGGKPG